MANATPRDTRAGFEIYRSLQTPVSLDQVNTRLESAGYGNVSSRTLGHYKKLMNAGCNRYIPINRFDVARASRAYENAASRARYSYLDVNAGVRVVFVISGRFFDAVGRSTQVGDPGAIIEFLAPEIVKGLRAFEPRVGDSVTLTYLETGRTVTGSVLEVLFEAHRCVIDVEYSGLTSIAELSTQTAAPTTPIGFTLLSELDDPHTTEIIGKRIYHFLELLEGLRSLTNRAGHAGDGLYTPPLRLLELRVESPEYFLIEVPQLHLILMPLFVGTMAAAGAVARFRLRWHEGTATDLDNQRKRFELRQLEQAARTADNTACDRVAAAMRGTAIESDLSPDTVNPQVNRDILPHARELGKSGVNDLQTDVTDQ